MDYDWEYGVSTRASMKNELASSERQMKILHALGARRAVNWHTYS